MLFSACTAPTPDLEQDRLRSVEEFHRELAERTERVMAGGTGILSLEDCIAIAVENSLELRIADERRAFERQAIDGAVLAMFPGMKANVAYTHRSNQGAEYSKTVRPDIPVGPKRYTTSDENAKTVASIETVWSLLDFGLSYFTWRQAHYREIVAKIQSEQTRRRLTLDVISAYLLLDASIRNTLVHERRLEIAQMKFESLRALVENGDLPLSEQLRAEEELRYVEANIAAEESRAINTRGRLASFLNVAESARLKILPLAYASDTRAQFAVYEPSALERDALLNRPELFEQDVRGKIDADEINKALLRFLPNVELAYSLNYTTNKYALHSSHKQAAARAAWDIIGLANRYVHLKSVERSAEINRMEKQVMTAGVLLNVRLAYLDYTDAVLRYENECRSLEIENELLRIAKVDLDTNGLARMKFRDIENSLLKRQTVLNQVAAEAKTREAIMRFSAGLDQVSFVKSVASE